MQNIFDDDHPFFVGANYWASNAGTFMWRDWDPAAVERDFRLLHENVQRASWPSSQGASAESFRAKRRTATNSTKFSHCSNAVPAKVFRCRNVCSSRWFLG